MMIPGGPSTGPVSRGDPSICRTLPEPPSAVLLLADQRYQVEGDLLGIGHSVKRNDFDVYLAEFVPDGVLPGRLLVGRQRSVVLAAVAHDRDHEHPLGG